MSINYAGEGPTDAALLRRLILYAGGDVGIDYTTARRGRGKDNIDRRLEGFNRAAKVAETKTIVLRDLDNDADCAPELIKRLFDVANHARFCFRIAVRQSVSWLMADANSFSTFFKINANRVPNNPELLKNPKQELLSLIGTSRSAKIKQEMLPTARSEISVGPGYVATLIDFIESGWDVGAAVHTGQAPSLTKSFNRLEGLIHS